MKTIIIDFNRLKIDEIPDCKLKSYKVYKSGVDFFGPDVIQNENGLPSSDDEGGFAA